MLAGLVIALIVLGAIYAFVAFRPPPAIGSNFGTAKTSFATSLPADRAFAAVAAAPSAGARYQVVTTDTGLHRVLLQDGMTMSSYGYYYPVDVTSAGGQTTVTVGIKSKYPLQFGPFVAKAQQKSLEAMAATLKARINATPA